MIFWVFPLIILVISIAFVVNKRSANLQSNQHLCFICEKKLSSSESYFFVEKSFCSKHIDAYKNKNWVLVLELECNPSKPEDGVRLYEFKVYLNSLNIDAFIESDYKEKDFEIFTTMKLYIESEKEEEVLKLLPL